MSNSRCSAPPGGVTSKGRQTRGRIVRAAAELIFARGVAGTTMEDVRAAAGVSSSQIYHYFTDKQALVLAVIEYQNDTIVGGQQAMLAGLDTLDGIRAWRDFLIARQRQLQCRGGCPIGTLGSELAETDPLARAHVAAGLQRWEDGIRSGLLAMYRRGGLPPDADPARLATATLAALQGGLLLTQIRRSTEPLEAAFDLVLDRITALTEAAPA